MTPLLWLLIHHNFSVKQILKCLHYPLQYASIGSFLWNGAGGFWGSLCQVGGTNSLYDLQCTMALSIEIEDFQVLKSKCLVFAQFLSKSNNSFFDWCKTANILIEKYFLRKYDQIFGIFLTKPEGLD